MLYRWIWIVIAAVGYATLHTSPPAWAEGDMRRAYFFQEERPLIHRVLPQIAARPLVEGVGISVEDAYWCIDAVSCAAFLAILLATLRPMVGERAAAVGTWAGLLVVYAAQFGPGPDVFYARYDLPALAFTVAGLYLALRGRYGWLTLLCLPAALNRETALMLPLAAVALRPGEWRRVLPAVAVVVAVRLALPVVMPAPGEVIDWTRTDKGDANRLPVNLALLASSPAVLLVHLSALPLAWAAVWRDIPADLRRLGWVSLAVGAGMLVVGNVDEPRVFGEALVLAWAPLVIGVRGWLAGEHRHPRMIRTA